MLCMYVGYERNIAKHWVLRNPVLSMSLEFLLWCICSLLDLGSCTEDKHIIFLGTLCANRIYLQQIYG